MAHGSRPTMKVGVLASGSGTILQALITAGIPIEVVLVDRKCRAIEVAEAAGIDSVIVERSSFGADFDRAAFTDEVLSALEPFDLDLLAMAGFMTILSASAFETYPNRIINTHPALLPAFTGAHAVTDALAYGVKVTGCTVHVATARVDDGPILTQHAVPVLPDDTSETLHERIKEVERRLFPATIRAILDAGGVDPRHIQVTDLPPADPPPDPPADEGNP